MLCDLTPAVFFLQETKRKISDPPFKTENISNYQVFELRREKEKNDGGKGLEGGGLAIGALHGLAPVLTREGDDATECLSVEIKVSNRKFLCVTGYGPQVGDTAERKKGFWDYLEEEAISARERDIGLIIQIDSNSWVGDEVIPGDPNKQNSNGKLMVEFLKRNPTLTVVNSLELCRGLVTRQRKTTRGEEKTVLDVFIVCRKVLPLVKHMEVDHENHYKLTSFKAKKIVPTDHNSVLLVLNLTIPKDKPDCTSFFNFKNSEGQVNFFHMTDNNNSLSEAFSTDKTFQQQVRDWDRAVKSCMHQSFPKIRHRKRKFRDNDVGVLLEKRKKLRLNPPSAQNDVDIISIEEDIVAKTEVDYSKKVREALGDIDGEDGRINGNEVWKATRKMFPKFKNQVPTAFKDKKGNLLTGYEAIKKFTLDSIVERLRKRPMLSNLLGLEKNKTKLARLRLKIASKKKTLPWTLKAMEKAIRSMKNKKCRDSAGIINELLKPEVAGRAFKLSLLSFLNKTKETLEIPHLMKQVHIALIPKPGKRKLHDIKNHRGIFLVSKFKSLMMKMLLNDKYPVIDKYMSDSNIGGRVNRGIRDHVFIVNGIIF